MKRYYLDKPELLEDEDVWIMRYCLEKTEYLNRIYVYQTLYGLHVYWSLIWNFHGVRRWLNGAEADLGGLVLGKSAINGKLQFGWMKCYMDNEKLYAI